MFSTLLVEADASFRQALSDVLYSYFPSISVDTVGNGQKAISQVAYRRPQLIFIDIGLPGENGLDATRMIKRVYNDIVIVILTAEDQPAYRQQALRSGADYLLSKQDDSCMENILARVEGVMAMESRG